MALQRQRIHIPLAGIDTKTDEKLVGPGKLLEVENGTFDELGAITKRKGFAEVTTQPDSTASERRTIFSTPTGLTIINGVTSYEYAPTAGEWITKGNLDPFSVSRVLFSNEDTRFAIQGEVSRSGNRMMAVWIEHDADAGTDHLCNSSMDATSFTTIRQPDEITTLARKYVRMDGDQEVASPSSNFYCAVFTATATLTLYRLSSASAGTNSSVAVSSAVGGLSTTSGGVHVHARTGDVDRIAICYRDGSTTIFRTYSTTLATPSLASTLSRAGTSDSNLVYLFANENMLLVKGDAHEFSVYDTDLTTAVQAWTTTGTSGGGTIELSLVEREDTYCVFSLTSPTAYTAFIKVTDDGTMTEVGRIYDFPSGGFGTYPGGFIGSGGEYYGIRDARSKTAAPSYHLQGGAADDSTYVVSSRLGYGDAMGSLSYAPGRRTTDTTTTATGKQAWLGFVKTVLASEDENEEYLTYPCMFIFDKEEKLSSLPVVGSSVLWPGTAYFEDKRDVTELGFLDTMRLFNGGESGSGGSLTNGTYLLALVLEYTDSSGRLHRSEPSNILSQAITGGASSNKATAVVDTVIGWSTEKKEGSCSLVLYRSLVDGSVLYRERTINGLSTVKSASAISFGLSTDAEISPNETLYTTGGVVPSVSPPPSRSMAISGDRLYSLSSDKSSEIWFTQPLQAGLGPEFSPFLVTEIHGGNGDATAIGAIDGRVIVFFERSISYFGGAGPGRSGLGSFSLPASIPSDVGCVNALSVVEIPSGLIFKSHKGFYLLDRGLSLHYIGADVEDYNSSDIVRGIVNRDENAVLFFLSGGTTLLRFDYFTSNWSVVSLGVATDDITVHGGDLYLYGTDGKVYQESLTVKDDDGVDYSLKITTPWIKLSGIEGYQRLYWVHLLGTYEGAHTIQIEISYDYDDTVSETLTEAFVSSPGTYDVRLKPTRQKCKSFKLSIKDISPTTNGLSFALSGIQCELGIKPQTGRNSVAPNASTV